MSRPFELRKDDDALTVLGELDIGTAPHFRRAVGGLLLGDAPHLVIDLSEADFVDSSGIAAIVWALFRARAAGGDIVVVDAHDTVGPAIALAGLDDLIPLRRERPTADYFIR